jgi:type IV pilus assembly protein PilQ
VRRAGLNVVLNDVDPTQTISLDVQDAPLQETFNFILRLKGLQARRVDQSVFIGSTLPGVQDRLVRSFRLNQAVVEDAQTFLEALAEQGGPLEGAQIITNERTQTVTVLGSPQQLDLAAAQIAQLDVRERQAILNVRIVDLNLSNNETLGASLAASSGQFAVTGLNPQGSFGGTPINQPAGSTGEGPIGSLGGPQTLNFSTLSRLQQALAAQIEAAITSGTGKVLADPRVTITQGGTSRLDIGQDVITNINRTSDRETGEVTVTFEKETAGVVLEVTDVRIDDNGFVTLSIIPTISSPGEVVTLADGTQVTLLNRRQADIQRVRFRDGETLVLAGLIQEQDLVNVQRIPLLSEIPILGALFRRQTIENSRQEVVLLLTPFILQD